MKEFIQKNYKNILIIVLVIILLLSFKTCSERDKEINEYKSYNEDFVEITDKNGKKLAIQEQQIISDKKLIKSLNDTLKELKSISTQIKIQTITKIKEVKVNIRDTVYITDSLGFRYLRVPVEFTTTDVWFALSGTIQDKGIILFDSISFINKPSIYIGYKKRTLKETLLFKKAERVVVYKDENPFVSTQKMSNFTVEERKNPFSLGIQVGWGATMHGFTPYLGVGLGYKLF